MSCFLCNLTGWKCSYERYSFIGSYNPVITESNYSKLYTFHYYVTAFIDLFLHIIKSYSPFHI